jgi:hypothetical protein
MKPLEIERPIKGQVTGLTQAFKRLVLDELPIHKWCKEQDIKNKK